MKYHIEKNTVQETLIIPLYGRKKCTEKFPQLFKDETAVRLIEQIDYDFSEVEKKGRQYDAGIWLFGGCYTPKRFSV